MDDSFWWACQDIGFTVQGWEAWHFSPSFEPFISRSTMKKQESSESSGIHCCAWGKSSFCKSYSLLISSFLLPQIEQVSDLKGTNQSGIGIPNCTLPHVLPLPCQLRTIFLYRIRAVEHFEILQKMFMAVCSECEQDFNQTQTKQIWNSVTLTVTFLEFLPEFFFAKSCIWFSCQTSKIPGALDSRFWGTGIFKNFSEDTDTSYP